jgi:hypothetical protein
MLIGIQKIKSTYLRKSKLNQQHSYSRTKTIAIFECDSCHNIFQRPIGKMDHRRLSNDFSHVCCNCDCKRFAQKKGVENRRFWNLAVDADISIDRL